MTVTWVDPQTGEVWYRKGQCNHCGGCCSTYCPYLRFIALRDIKKGESFVGIGKQYGNMIAVCDVFDSDIVVKTGCVACTPQARKNFPSTPLVTPECCGYYWVNSEGKRWVRQEHDYTKGV